MDSLTQAALGATVQGCLLGRWQGRKALLYGAVLATIPDLDVLIDYGDAVANMTYHRGFSHSLFVLTAFALLLSWLVRRCFPQAPYPAHRLYLTVWLVLITHTLLDAFTSYGTQLFWPLMPTPTAWSTIFIIDPLYTLPLLIAIGIGLISAKPQKSAAYALLLSCIYLAFTVSGKIMAEHRVKAEMAREGIHAQAIFSTPTPLNALLWRVTVIEGDHYYEALTGWFDSQPPALVRLPRHSELAGVLKNSAMHQRLEWFTAGFLRYDRVNDHLIVTDIRLGMTGFHPLRFDFAHLENGQWQLQAPIQRLPIERGDWASLKLLLNRIWQPQLAVPLDEWGATLEQPIQP